mgnify:CR=1 FL=1
MLPDTFAASADISSALDTYFGAILNVQKDLLTAIADQWPEDAPLGQRAVDIAKCLADVVGCQDNQEGHRARLGLRAKAALCGSMASSRWWPRLLR